MAQYRPGDHLIVKCGPINHHGIYISGTINELGVHIPGHTVVDYSGEKLKGVVQERDIDDFCRGNKPWVFDYTSFVNKLLLELSSLGNPYDVEVRTLPREMIVLRALSQVGEDWYDVFEFNCEHFAHWCAIGYNVSTQSDGLKGLFMPGGIDPHGKAKKLTHRENQFNYRLYKARNSLGDETVNFIKRNPFLQNYVYNSD